MSFNNVAIPQVICDRTPVSEHEVLFEAAVALRHIVRARVDIAPVLYCLMDFLDIEHCDALWVGKDLGYPLGDRDFVDTQVGVRGNDGAIGEVNALPGQIAPKAALLPLEPLTESTNGFLAHL